MIPKIHFSHWCHALAFLLMAYLTLPLLAMIAFSFSAEIVAIPTNFTFEWYTIQLHQVLYSVQVSFMIAVPAILLGFAVSLPLAYALARRRFFGRAILDQLTLLPVLIPGTVLGLALLEFFNTGVFSRVPPLGVLILAHTLIVVPVIARPLIAALGQIDQRMEEAAQSLGAGPLRTFRDITFPLISSATLVGLILGLARSLTDFTMTLFLVGPNYVPLSIYIYNSTHFSIPQITSAQSVILLALSLVVIFVAERFTRTDYVV